MSSTAFPRLSPSASSSRTNWSATAPRKAGVITAEFESFYVVTVYTPNAKDDLSRLPLRFEHWDPAFLAYCKQLEKKKPVIFCGDLNVAHTELDLANPKPNRGKKGFTDEERKGFQNMVDAGFVDTFRMFTQGNGHYTWWSHFANSRARNVGWRIDYVLVSAKLRSAVKAAKIHADVMGSDHCPVSITLDGGRRVNECRGDRASRDENRFSRASQPRVE